MVARHFAAHPLSVKPKVKQDLQKISISRPELRLSIRKGLKLGSKVVTHNLGLGLIHDGNSYSNVGA